MKKPRKPRNANRGTLQAIEDGFADLDITQQEKMLETLAKLHHWTKRERARHQVAGPSELLMDVMPRPVDSAYTEEPTQ